MVSFQTISFIILILTSAIFVNGNDISEMALEDIQNQLNDLLSRIQDVEKKNEDLTIKVQDCQNENKDLNSKFQNLEDDFKDIEQELEYLRELSKLNVVRTCEEMSDYGVNQSNFYYIDPDGPLIGQEPIHVYCDFAEENIVSTRISHNSEEKLEVEHCHDPGCYFRHVFYDAPMEQIQALIELSESCQQEIKYDCFLAPLEENNVEFGYWLDRHGDTQIYWTGNNSGNHVCACHYSQEGCIEQETLNTTCNCDAKIPAELFDQGTITNASALPITELRFGGLAYDSQSAFHTLGELMCNGKKVEEPKATSCASLKRDGYFKSGYYNIKENQVGQHSKLVYCDMSGSGYDNVNEETVDYLNLAPVGTILAWTPYPDKNNDNPATFPSGWVLCDGSQINEGIWKGQTTPDLNGSKRFLRGGHVEDALNLEEDSLQDHTHSHSINDPGHVHPYIDRYYSRQAGDDKYGPSSEDTNGGPWDGITHQTSSSGKTGISMSVNGVSDARTGSETKPKNMNVVYIMKVC